MDEEKLLEAFDIVEAKIDTLLIINVLLAKLIIRSPQTGRKLVSGLDGLLEEIATTSENPLRRDAVYDVLLKFRDRFLKDLHNE